MRERERGQVRRKLARAKCSEQSEEEEEKEEEEEEEEETTIAKKDKYTSLGAKGIATSSFLLLLVRHLLLLGRHLLLVARHLLLVARHLLLLARHLFLSSSPTVCFDQDRRALQRVQVLSSSLVGSCMDDLWITSPEILWLRPQLSFDTG